MFPLNKLKIHIYGSSHAPKIGLELTGIRAGEILDLPALQAFLDRRKASNAAYSTSRKEPDEIVWRSGVHNGVTTGEPIVAEIMNTDIKRGDYNALQYIPRPSHADYPAYIKYGLEYDLSGGGEFSGRMTAPFVVAGGIASAILMQKGVSVAAYIAEIAGIAGGGLSTGNHPEQEILAAKNKMFPVIDDAAGEKMLEAIAAARAGKDSLGGVIEAAAFGVPAGTGGAMMNGLESKIAALLFAVPAVKGVEFGTGFALSLLRGSEANDCYYYDGSVVRTRTNHNGGIVGGMANGMPVVVRAAIKPTPSIGRPQESVNLKTQEPVQLTIHGRHDACIVPRAAVAVESAIALAILDELY